MEPPVNTNSCVTMLAGGVPPAPAVNISSSCAYSPIPQASAYTASKFAVRGYSDAVRVELAPFGVHVMHVAPG